MPPFASPSRDPAPSAAPRGGAVVRALGFVGDDAALVEALRGGHPGAAAALYDRHGRHVQRVLARVLGADAELDDLLGEVFLRALVSLDTVKDGAALRAWMTSIAVFTARERIRRRRRGRWLRLFGADDAAHEPAAVAASGEMTEAVRATYAVLDALPPDERIPLALRLIDGMELTEVAAACRVSLATIKRRLARAERSFVARARAHPVLREWVEGGSRWGGAT